MATAGLSLGTKLLSFGLNLWAKHTARLKGAKNENEALDQIVPAFDADLAEIVDAYNKGEATAGECVQALQNVDNNIFQYLLSQVGPLGTAWSGPKTLGGNINASYHADCGKLCTAGCCVYLNDLRPAIYGRSGVGSSFGPYQTSTGVVGGLIEAIQNGGGTVHVIPIAKPTNTAYGNYQRDTYDLTVTKPLNVASVSGTLNKSIEKLLGMEPDSVLSNLGVGSSAPGEPGGQKNILLIVLVFLGLLVGLQLAGRS